jgi:bifunctional non-homologous end joining protein LigD
MPTRLLLLVTVVRRFDPMLVTSGPLPVDESRYAFEPKWDGFRALVYVDGRVRVVTRRGTDVSERFPELGGLARAAPADTVLDGELVVLGADGHPDFDAMCHRAFTGRGPGQLVFVAFDVLHLDGVATIHLPYAKRRTLLESMALDGPAWRITSSHPGEGTALFQATKDLGLEGVVAKALHAPYRPGVRSKTWIKTKHWRRGRFVVGGFSPADPQRDRHAALLIGSPDPDGHLRFAGALEWGFAWGQLEEIRGQIRRRASSPFAGIRGWRDVEHAEPEIEVEVQYLERTSVGNLRHASFKGFTHGA